MNDPWLNPSWWLIVTACTSALSAVVMFVVTQLLTHLWQRHLSRQLRRKAEAYAKRVGRIEAALVLSVLNDIRPAAESHLEKNGCGGVPMFQVHQKEGFGDDDGHWAAYLEKVKTEVRKVRELGATRVYVFAALPVAMAVFVGSTLTNGPEVIVHHYAGGSYIPVGRLAVDTVRL